MRKWTLSACVALAWSISVPLLAMAGPVAPGHPDQATTTTASITQATLASWPGTAQAPLADAPGAPQAPAHTNTAQPDDPATALAVIARPADNPVTWTVRPGDTLSAVAAALAIPGGWQPLYTANQQAIGPNPNVIRPGTVLVVPGAARPARYTVAPGDTLSAVAAALAVPGGWQRLYAANRQAIGPDPNVIRPGTVLSLPRRAPAVAARGQGPQGTSATARRHQALKSSFAPAPASAPRSAGTPVPTANAAAGRTGSRRATADVMTPAGGMPKWLEDVLLAMGLLAATAFAVEPAAALARRRQAAGPAKPSTPQASRRMRRRARRAAARANIILTHYDRLIVTYSADDHTVYVFTPPGEDPRAVLRAARLVLPEDTYEDLAGHLGVPSAWPRE